MLYLEEIARVAVVMNLNSSMYTQPGIRVMHIGLIHHMHQIVYDGRRLNVRMNGPRLRYLLKRYNQIRRL